MDFPGVSEGKELACSAGDLGLNHGLVGKISWQREWLPTPVFFPGKYYEQRSLVGYNPWVAKI